MNISKIKNEGWQFYDLDNFTLERLQRYDRLLDHIRIYHDDMALVRISSSGQGLHLAVKGNKRCYECERWADKKHNKFIDVSGNQILFRQKGRKKVSKWFRVKDLKIWVNEE